MNRQEAGRLGGLITFLRYGSEGMAERGRLGGRPRVLILERQHQALVKENEKGGMDTPQSILATNNLSKLKSLYLCQRSNGNRNKTEVGSVFPH